MSISAALKYYNLAPASSSRIDKNASTIRRQAIATADTILDHISIGDHREGGNCIKVHDTLSVV
jgi:hypothetical protein